MTDLSSYVHRFVFGTFTESLPSTAMTRKSWRDLHLGEEALGGLSAGIVGTVIGFPLDTVKTRMQTGTAKAGSGIVKVARNVVKHEGFFSLYKGIGPPLISLSILGTLTFTQYSYFQEVYQSDPGWDFRNYLAGISCSPVAGMVSTIENMIKVGLDERLGYVICTCVQVLSHALDLS